MDTRTAARIEYILGQIDALRGYVELLREEWSDDRSGHRFHGHVSTNYIYWTRPGTEDVLYIDPDVSNDVWLRSSWIKPEVGEPGCGFYSMSEDQFDSSLLHRPIEG